MVSRAAFRPETVFMRDEAETFEGAAFVDEDLGEITHGTYTHTHVAPGYPLTSSGCFSPQRGAAVSPSA